VEIFIIFDIFNDFGIVTESALDAIYNSDHVFFRYVLVFISKQPDNQLYGSKGDQALKKGIHIAMIATPPGKAFRNKNGLKISF
jgi:hypothetical protein